MLYPGGRGPEPGAPGGGGAAGSGQNAELARNIAGHAAIHFTGTVEESAATIHEVLDSTESLRRTLAGGRSAYFLNGIIVIVNPAASYGGTAYAGSFQAFLDL